MNLHHLDGPDPAGQRDLNELLNRLVTLLLTGYTTDEQLISLLSNMQLRCSNS